MSLEDQEREGEELTDFDIGFQAELVGEPLDEAATDNWQRGWRHATEVAEAI